MIDLRVRDTRSRASVLAAGVVAVLAGLAYVGLRDPHDPSTAMPRCPWHWATGLDCPGCGGLRMTHDLQHGDLGAAFADNALLLVLTPLLLGLAGRAALQWVRGGPVRVDRRSGWTLLAVAVLWTVVRNLTGW